MYYEFCIIYVVIVKNNSINNYFNKKVSNWGDWGLGIGDWAQSPIPNPQSPT